MNPAGGFDLLTPIAVEHFDKFVKHVLRRDIGRMHVEIIETLAQPDTKNLGVLAGRFLYKSSLISRAHSLWECWRETYLKRQPDFDPFTVTIQCHNLALAKEQMRQIQNEVESNPILKEALLPEQLSDNTWNATQVEFKNKTRIVALPFGGAARGWHPMINVCDDIYKNEEGRIVTSEIERVSTTFWTSVFPTVIHGKHLVVGTPAAFNDLYHEIKDLAEKKAGWKFLFYPAVIEDDRGNWVESQFPEKYPLEFWRERYAQMPSWAWLQEHMCRPVGNETAIFPSQVVDAAMALPWPDLTPEDIKMRNFYLGADIAFGEGKSADYSAFYFIEKVPGRPLHAFKREVMRGVPEDKQIDLIKSWHSQFHFHKIFIEQKGISWSMANKLRSDEVTRGYVYPFDTNHNTKEKLISSLSMLLRDKQLKLDNWKELVAQLSSFGIKTRNGAQTFEALTGHDDEVIGLALACEAAGGWVAEPKGVVSIEWI